MTPGHIDEVTNISQGPADTLADDLLYLTANTFSFSIAVNDERCVYQLVDDEDADSYESAEDMQRCIDANFCVWVQAYPNTPIGFYAMRGSDLPRTVRRCREAVEADRA